MRRRPLLCHHLGLSVKLRAGVYLYRLVLSRRDSAWDEVEEEVVRSRRGLARSARRSLGLLHSCFSLFHSFYTAQTSTRTLLRPAGLAAPLRLLQILQSSPRDRLRLFSLLPRRRLTFFGRPPPTGRHAYTRSFLTLCRQRPLLFPSWLALSRSVVQQLVGRHTLKGQSRPPTDASASDAP